MGELLLALSRALDPNPNLDPQSLAMTRSIGDLYMQSFGVTWEPEVIAIDLQEECTELEHLTLVIASDGCEA